MAKKDPFESGVRGQETVRDNLDFGGPVCTAEEDKCRQEYGPQSQIGYQISRFGVGHPLQFGQVDYDSMDLTRAMELIEQSGQAWLSLPKVVRDRYQSWGAVEAAAASGELQQLLKAAGADGGSSPSGAVADVGAGGTSPEAPKGP